MDGACSTYGRVINAYKILVENAGGTTSVKRQGVYARIILKLILNKQSGIVDCIHFVH
jgi:alcohol dehydrogenase YqhD (iron-dependent ADH family)